MSELVNKLIGDPLSLVFHMVNLILLYFGLKHFLYKPVKAFMVKRDAEYKEQRDKIEADKAEIQTIKEQYREKIAGAQEEAARIVAERAELAQRQASEMLLAANREAHALITQAERESVSERARQREEMRREMIDLSVEMAKRVLEREIDAGDHQRMFEEFLNDVG